MRCRSARRLQVRCVTVLQCLLVLAVNARATNEDKNITVSEAGEVTGSCGPEFTQSFCGVLVPAGWRTAADCARLGRCAVRHALLVELSARLDESRCHLKKLGDLGMVDVAAGSVMLVRLKIRHEVDLRYMTDLDVWNTLIQWLSPRTGRSIADLENLDRWSLVTYAQQLCGQQGGSWRCFATAAQFLSDPWHAYHQLVYGVEPAVNYPFCLSDMWMFYDSAVAQVGAAAPPSTGECPSVGALPSERYRTNNIYAPLGTSWAWHAPPYASFPSGTWVEVIHEADPFGDEHFGAWFMYARGSGMWFDIGNTIGFQEHSEAYAHFGATGNEDLAKKAAAAGYDSVQFLAHVDHVNYPCDSSVQAPYMNVEILGVKLVGTYACTTAAGAPSSISAGWPPAQKRPCTCDNTKRGLNCNGVGQTRPGWPLGSLVV